MTEEEAVAAWKIELREERLGMHREPTVLEENAYRRGRLDRDRYGDVKVVRYASDKRGGKETNT